MRFKAKITNEYLAILLSVTTSLQKIGSSSVLYLDEECLRFAVIAEAPDSPRVYSELLQEFLFAEYRIESQNNNASKDIS